MLYSTSLIILFVNYYCSKKLRYFKKRQNRALKQKRRRNSWLRVKNQRLTGKSVKQKEYDNFVSISHFIRAPDILSVKDNPDEVFKFITEIKETKYKSSIKNIHIKLKHCKEIKNDAIALLISAIQDLKPLGKKVSGDYPINPSVKSTLEKSGFFDYVIGDVSEENKRSNNTITQQGVNTVDSEVIAPLVTNAMKSVWGVAYRNPKIQSLLIELMANSVNHAFTGKINKSWYLSIHHESENNKVGFTFIDNGQGITSTLNIKFLEKIKNLVLNSNDDVIKAAFDGKFGSRTKEKKRGRGLPNIKKCFTENYIDNLVVITNDVFYDFQTNTTKKLFNTFDGTCYHWELTTNCVKWNII